MSERHAVVAKAFGFGAATVFVEWGPIGDWIMVGLYFLTAVIIGAALSVSPPKI